MLATKNPARAFLSSCIVASAVFFAGCMASGPRALLDGDEALRDGKFNVAIGKLKRATELLPDEPRAWNLLGLAYHNAGQLQVAEQAYRNALKLDRSNMVSTIVHFNLGCLLLEQGDAAGAAHELRSFSMVTNSALAWVRLGEAQLRLRQFTEAERSFALAIKAEPKNVAAYNDLGVLYAQRKSAREALPYVNAALQWNPKYAPALLNSAILLQQNPATRNAALLRYRDYLAVQPRPANAAAVEAAARQLESEFPPKVATPTNVIVATPTNVPSVTQTTAPPKVVATATNEPSRPAIVQPNPPRVALVQTNPPRPAPQAPITNAPASVPVTTVQVTPPAPVKVATSAPPVVNAKPPSARVTNTSPPLVTVPPPSDAGVAAEPPRKEGFFTRLNPFRSKPERATAVETGRVVVVANPSGTSANSTSGPEKSFERYRYINPSVPLPGARAEAERAFQQAQKAARAGNTNEALLAYQLSMRADPSYLDAQYNAALLTQQAGAVKRSLPLWEMALAIEPDSINARYNFALALKQAEFPYEAAAELERILEAKPKEARAHLTLANLYAQQLRDNRRAREHYQKLLELDPRNSQASAIRFWMAANP